MIRDKYGIPVFKRADIEEHAEEFLAYFDHTCLEVPKATPLASIADQLRRDHNVKFDFTTDLGVSPSGQKYLGRFIVPSQTICVDPSVMDPDPRFPFTLAHELGHFVFHREVDVEAIRGASCDSIDDTEEELGLHRINGDKPMSFVEWQANTFAAALLVPRRTAKAALIATQEAMGITRRIGAIFITEGQPNRDDFWETIEAMARYFQTSKHVMRIRLKEIDLIIEKRKGGLKAIKDILPGVLGGIVGSEPDT